MFDFQMWFSIMFKLIDNFILWIIIYLYMLNI